MNYIEQIRGFWRSHDVEAFPPNAIALYFYLLEVNNKASWIALFKRNNSKICADLGISYPTLNQLRNRLKQSGLIDFKTTNGNANVTYSLKNFLEVSNEVTNEVGDEVTNEVCSRLPTSKYKPKLKPKLSIDGVPPSTPEDLLKKKKKDFVTQLAPFAEKYGKDLLNAFYRYWTEPNKSKTKLRWEMEKTWDLSLRLVTWASRDKNFNKNQS